MKCLRRRCSRLADNRPPLRQGARSMKRSCLFAVAGWCALAGCVPPPAERLALIVEGGAQ